MHNILNMGIFYYMIKKASLLNVQCGHFIMRKIIILINIGLIPIKLRVTIRGTQWIKWKFSYLNTAHNGMDYNILGWEINQLQPTNK